MQFRFGQNIDIEGNYATKLRIHQVMVIEDTLPSVNCEWCRCSDEIGDSPTYSADSRNVPRFPRSRGGSPQGDGDRD